jgi:HK97 family phage prohead protease
MQDYVRKTMGIQGSKLKFSNVSADLMEFEGYASVYGNVDLQGDVIHYGAFAGVVEKQNSSPIFVNHDTNAIPVGKFLPTREDTYGLYGVGVLTKGLSTVPDLWAAMKANTMEGLSVNFPIKGTTFQKTATGYDFTKIEVLKELSICTYPANESAGFTVLKNMDGLETIRDIEDWLRESANFSKAKAQELIGLCKTAVLRDLEQKKSAEIIQQIQSLSKFN